MREPESIGLGSKRVARIRRAIEKHISNEKIAGAVTLLARNGTVIRHESYGYLSRETQAPMTNDAMFRIYSMTKPITCVALLTLVERSDLQLVDAVAKFIPAVDVLQVLENGNLVDQSEQMKIWHLLTHTAGFTYRGTPGPVGDVYRRLIRTSRTSLADLIEGLLQAPLCFHPGARFEYGFSHDVVARIVEIVSGMQYDQYLRETIFEPLGMCDTGFHVPPNKTGRFASMYGAANMDAEPAEVTSQIPIDMHRNVLLADAQSDYVAKAHTHFRGGHGLVSTTTDYHRFCEMLLRGGELDGVRILGRKTVELMRTNQLPKDLLPYNVGGMPQYGQGYGLGVRVMIDPGQAHALGSVGDFGWGGAASTYFWIDPVERMIGVQMAQYQPPLIHRIGSDFRNAAYQAIID
jgi:CubicO group peptidase (beta-lactamase class C family)